MSSSYSESILAMCGTWSEGWRVYNVITRVRKTQVYNGRGLWGKQVFQRVSCGPILGLAGKVVIRAFNVGFFFSIASGPLKHLALYLHLSPSDALAWLTGRMMTIDTVHAVKKYAISHVSI
ncbi:hypothetical protein JB92DRAFT_2824319 [Gautieria morchelliformis]|nr:hypothetical protein JB92DRAFT_2824319 [Gautieria morchelliformis]